MLKKSSAKIYRDDFGIPHIYGNTDEDVVFSFMYAQAEDNFQQIEDDLIHLLGYAAQIYGEKYLLNDYIRRAFRIEELARMKYRKSTRKIQKLCRAYSQGLNHFLGKNPEIKPKLFTEFKPWFVLARSGPLLSTCLNLGIKQQEIIDAMDKTTSELNEINFSCENKNETKIDDERAGSNIWAINSSKSVSGNPIIVIDSHTPFWGLGQRYEAHLYSRQGLNVQGFAILGTPYIRSGHNGKIAWGHSNSKSKAADLYLEDIEINDNYQTYKFGDENRKITSWEAGISIKKEESIEERLFKFRETHHGPIIAFKNGKFISCKFAMLEEDEFPQRWRMCKAKSVSGFKASLKDLKIVGANTICIDNKGNIAYFHGGAAPKRAADFDWTKPVDGNNVKTEWQGYHSFNELPQITNPASGWLQNCNSSFFLTTEDDDFRAKEKYPQYMTTETDSARSQRLREILKNSGKLSFEDALQIAADVFVMEARLLIPQLLSIIKQSAKESAFNSSVAQAGEILQKWDFVSKKDSIAMTIFSFWFQKIYSNRMRDPDYEKYNLPSGWLKALKDALNELEALFGTFKVKWGEINRLQRVDRLNNEDFSDALSSLPAIGGWGTAGVLFTFFAPFSKGNKQRYGTFGSSFICIIELGKKIKYHSIVPFGQSANPLSPHYTDQSALYAEGKFKVGYFDFEEIEKISPKCYYP